jgi:hypothetical protein
LSGYYFGIKWGIKMCFDFEMMGFGSEMMGVGYDLQYM